MHAVSQSGPADSQAARDTARLRIRQAQRRVVFATCLVVLCAIAMGLSFATGWTMAPWIFDPLAVFGFCYMVRATVLRSRAREQADRAQEGVDAAMARHRALRQLTAPDAAAGQCPVCGLDDLDDLAGLDQEMDESETSRFRRVTRYGKRRAHKECAELVPYEPTADEREAEAHRGHSVHGVPIPQFGCSRCARENAKRRAEQERTPRHGISMAELGRALANAFAVPPTLTGLGDRDAQSFGFTSRQELLQAAQRAGLLSPDDLRRFEHEQIAYKTLDRKALTLPKGLRDLPRGY